MERSRGWEPLPGSDSEPWVCAARLHVAAGLAGGSPAAPASEPLEARRLLGFPDLSRRNSDLEITGPTVVTDIWGNKNARKPGPRSCQRNAVGVSNPPNSLAGILQRAGLAAGLERGGAWGREGGASPRPLVQLQVFFTKEELGEVQKLRGALTSSYTGKKPKKTKNKQKKPLVLWLFFPSFHLFIIQI